VVALIRHCILPVVPRNPRRKP